MTAEKGEHERAPRAGESCPTPLRATLRAPPAKWAIEAFFPAGERSEPRSRTARRAPADRSPRREAGRAASGVAVPLAFFGTFFRTERKYYPSQGGSPTVRAVVGASCTRSGFPSGKVGVYRHRQVLSAHYLHPFGSPTQAKQHPIRLHLCFRAVVGAPFHRLGGEILTTESLTADKSRGSFLGANTRQTTACRFLPLEKQTARLVLPCRLLLC